MSRHVYLPPKGRLTGLFALIGGSIATICVFLAIPLSQKLTQSLGSASPEAPEIVVEPPEEANFELDTPPDEPEQEPEPEEMVEESSELDFGIDLGDLSAGPGGGFLMEIPKFGTKGAEDMFGGDDLDSPPTPVSKFSPNYPNSLLNKGIGGRVLISCTVGIGGEVLDLTVKQSSGRAELDQSAMSAIKKWKFKPAIKAGKKIKAVCIIPLNFEVKKN
jgi:protein TonB